MNGPELGVQGWLGVSGVARKGLGSGSAVAQEFRGRVARNWLVIGPRRLDMAQASLLPSDEVFGSGV